jgi:hypothetical protein
MKKIVFVEQRLMQRWNGNGYVTRSEWFSDSCKEAAQGFRKMGYEVFGFLPEEFEDLKFKRKLNKNTIVKGSIRTVRRALSLVGASQPKNIDIPESLMKFANRKIWKSTLGQVRRQWLVDRINYHVKPLDYQKAFNGHIFCMREGYNYDTGRYTNRLEEGSTTKDFPDDFPVLVQEMVELNDEVRIYINNRKIVGNLKKAKRYSSSPWIPSLNLINQMIESYKDQPIAYALDIARMIQSGTSREKPVLVEVNEGFSCGNYYLGPVTYAKLTESRWKEMVSTKNK